MYLDIGLALKACAVKMFNVLPRDAENLAEPLCFAPTGNLEIP